MNRAELERRHEESLEEARLMREQRDAAIASQRRLIKAVERLMDSEGGEPGENNRAEWVEAEAAVAAAKTSTAPQDAVLAAARKVVDLLDGDQLSARVPLDCALSDLFAAVEAVGS